MPDPQNTISGTSNGGNIIESLGNSVLEGIASVSNVATKGLDTYSSFLERLTALRASRNEQVNKPPMQTPNVPMGTGTGFFTDPASTQGMFLKVAAIAGIVFLLYKAVK